MQNNGYFSHDADLGIQGFGNTPEEAFIDAAKKCFAIMVNLNQVKPSHTIQITFDESDLEFAFVTWLNQLIGHAREHGLILSEFKLHRVNEKWIGEARGQPWSSDLEKGTEVKGATLTALSVKEENGLWVARCVVDM